jgi:hypothetical protein
MAADVVSLFLMYMQQERREVMIQTTVFLRN